MPKAFILLNVETGSEDEVLNQLKELTFVEESFVAYGGYDLIIRVKAESMTELKETVSHKIRTLDKVRSTLTLILMEE
jgi:DNA-binding Lrp family transcriptional regulator